MEKLFWVDPCQPTLHTRIESVSGNDIIMQNLAIQPGFSDLTSQKCFWKIDDFAEVLCGGRHVKSTAEVGFVFLKWMYPGKSLERIKMTLTS